MQNFANPATMTATSGYSREGAPCRSATVRPGCSVYQAKKIIILEIFARKQRIYGDTEKISNRLGLRPLTREHKVDIITQEDHNTFVIDIVLTYKALKFM